MRQSGTELARFFRPARRSGQRSRGFALVALLLLAGAACGGDLDPAITRLPPLLDLRQYLTGVKTGYMTVFDRNNSIRETAQVTRNCRVDDATVSGVCEDHILYRYSQQEETQRFVWKAVYQNDFEGVVEAQIGEHSLSGRISGNTLLLEGTRATPAAPERTVSCDFRLQALPGDRRPLYQFEDYSSLGVSLGRAEILWLDGP